MCEALATGALIFVGNQIRKEENAFDFLLFHGYQNDSLLSIYFILYLITDKMFVPRPHPFIDNVHLVYYGNGFDYTVAFGSHELHNL